MTELDRLKSARDFWICCDWGAVASTSVSQVIGTKNGASEGIRTLDIHLGKVTLYQAELRSLPKSRRKGKGTAPDCKSSFVDFLPP